MLHLAREGVLSRAAAVPAAARRHDLEVPGHVRAARPHGRASWAWSCWSTTTRKRRALGINPFDHGSADPHRHVEDARAEAGARQVRLRRGLRRRAPRRGKEPRQGAHLLLPHAPAIAGTRRTSAPSCGTCTTRASMQGREASASSRSRTGPSSTSGSTSTSRTFRSCRCTSPRARPVVERDGTLIMVDDDRLPLEPGETPMMKKVRFRTLGCYPLTGAVESDGRPRCRRSSRRCC